MPSTGDSPWLPTTIIYLGAMLARHAQQGRGRAVVDKHALDRDAVVAAACQGFAEQLVAQPPEGTARRQGHPCVALGATVGA
jgi:hypothetical protein